MVRSVSSVGPSFASPRHTKALFMKGSPWGRCDPIPLQDSVDLDQWFSTGAYFAPQAIFVVSPPPFFFLGRCYYNLEARNAVKLSTVHSIVYSFLNKYRINLSPPFPSTALVWTFIISDKAFFHPACQPPVPSSQPPTLPSDWCSQIRMGIPFF